MGYGREETGGKEGGGKQLKEGCGRRKLHRAQLTYHSDKFKELYDGRIKKIVSLSIVFECCNNWIKQLPLDDVTVVEFIF